MNEFRFEGIVIGHEDWGDVDRVISFYTPAYGKIEAVARGVRYEKSKLKGHLELLTHGFFSVADGRARAVLTDAAAIENYPRVREFPERTYLGLAIAALYDANIFPGMPDEGLWGLLTSELTWLNSEEIYSGVALRDRAVAFLRRFIETLGYGALGGVAPRLLDTAFSQHDFTGPKPSEIFASLGTLAAPL